MANTKGVSFAGLFPDQQQDQANVALQMQLAAELLKKGQKQPDPNRSAGAYIVPTSPFENLAGLADTLVGAKMSKDATNKQTELENQRTQKMAQLIFGNAGGKPWTNPDTGEVMGGQSQAGGTGGPFSIPGVPPQISMMIAQADPEHYAQNVAEGWKMTEGGRRDRELGIAPGDSRGFELAKRAKEGTQSYGPGTFVQPPGGSPYITPDVANNLQSQIGPNGQVTAGPIPGAAGARGQLEDVKARAGARYDPIDVVLPGGARKMTKEQFSQMGDEAALNSMVGRDPVPAGMPADPAASGAPVLPNKLPGIGVTSPAQQGAEQKLLSDQASDLVQNREAVRQAAVGYAAIQEAKKQLDAGIFSGTGAEAKLGFFKVAKTVGLVPPDANEKIANTESFISTMGKQVVDNMKGLTPASNTDRDFIERMVAGKVTLDENTMRHALAIQERQLERRVNDHNKRVESMGQKMPSLYDMRVNLSDQNRTKFREIPQ